MLIHNTRYQIHIFSKISCLFTLHTAEPRVGHGGDLVHILAQNLLLLLQPRRPQPFKGHHQRREHEHEQVWVLAPAGQYHVGQKEQQTGHGRNRSQVARDGVDGFELAGRVKDGAGRAGQAAWALARVGIETVDVGE